MNNWSISRPLWNNIEYIHEYYCISMEQTKTECVNYYKLLLASFPQGCLGCLYLGFKRPPSSLAIGSTVK